MTITLMHYTATDVQEKQLSSVEEIQEYRDQPGVLWLHMQGLADRAAIDRLGELFTLHPLALEDVTAGPQRPKAEEFDEQDFIVTHTVSEDKATHRLQYVQFSMFVGNNYVLSFQGGDQDRTEEVRTRIRTARGPIRQHGVDHLMYSLLDSIIDGYFPVLEDFGEYLETVQEEALLRDAPETLRNIQRAKHELLHLRRVVWPHRDLLNVL
ncbi:MAG: CorA family divalent cation transporter, partial [Armatimonadota bacterium]